MKRRLNQNYRAFMALALIDFGRHSGMMLGLFTCFLLFGCYEKQEGCLDHRATNFDAFADLPCESCCTYPDLKYTISHFLGAEPFKPTDTIRNALNEHLFFISAGFLINNSVFNPDGASFTTSSRRNVVIKEGSSRSIINAVDDFVGAGTKLGSSYTYGAHNYKGEVTNLNLTLGLTDEFNGVQPDSFPSSHPLRDEAKNFYIEADVDYAAAFLQIVFDTMTRDTFTYRVPLADLSAQVQLDTQFTIEFGAEIKIPLKMDYLQWIEGINFVDKALDQPYIQAKIVENLPNALSIGN